ncbi:MAG: substrate binding domain-containing protein, partial [Gemmobacter sp.]
TFGEIYVGATLGRFAAAHPGLTFDLRLSDRYADLAGEGIDLAFRIGSAEVLSIKTRKLGAFQSVAVASPTYLENFGTPATPQDLRAHGCIVDTNRRSPRRWRFFDNGTEVLADVQGRFHVNSARAAVELAVAGQGIAYAPRFALKAEIESGSLVQLLPGFTGESGPVSAAYLEGRTLPRKIRALIDFAATDIRAAGIL